MHGSNYNDDRFKDYLPEIENQILHNSIDLGNAKPHIMNNIEAMIIEAPLHTTIALHAYQTL